MNLLAEITLSTEAAVAITGLLSAVAGAAAWGVKGWIASLTSDRDSWRDIALANINDLELVANKQRKARGKPPMGATSPVVPESSSPPTAKQRQTASIATVRARQALLRKELGLPAQQDESAKVLADMTETMKDQVDDAVEQIKDTVEEAGEATKDKIDEIA